MTARSPRVDVACNRDCDGVAAAPSPPPPAARRGEEGVGVRIRSWGTTHGFALNIRGALQGFDWIIPCGLEGRGVTSVERQLRGEAVSDKEIHALVEDAASAVMKRYPVRRDVAELMLLDV